MYVSGFNKNDSMFEIRIIITRIINVNIQLYNGDLWGKGKRGEL